MTKLSSNSVSGPQVPHSVEASGEPGTAYVVSVGDGRDPAARQAQLAEILSLVQSRGSRVLGHEICHLATPNPRTLLGKGTAADIAARARACGATELVLDAELSPSQARNLEEVAGIPICDREAVILDVFLRSARTRRAQIQVEIAQLQYLRPRIRGLGLGMDQQKGGNKLARGPGETASELQVRKLDTRLTELQKALRRIDTSALTQRRQRELCRRIALVGYTNAGKTSLMNALTDAELSARDRPFETLDTTSRCLTRHGGEVVVSDTVGFIRRLPERLLASFDSTLAEVSEASLLAVVVDVADEERELQVETTHEVLARIGAADVPRLYVFNKADRLDVRPSAFRLDRLSGGHPWVLLSANDPGAAATLATRLLREVREQDVMLTTFLPYEASDLLALAYARCRVVESEAKDAGLRLVLEGPRPVLDRLRTAAAS